MMPSNHTKRSKMAVLDLGTTFLDRGTSIVRPTSATPRHGDRYSSPMR